MAATDTQESDFEDLYQSRHHEHKLRFSKTLEVFECKGCKEKGKNIGYSCPKCKDFKLHYLCASHPDEADHPLEGNDKKLKFRCHTTVPGTHRCKVCKETIRGFVFSSEIGCKRFRAHPLCIDLPRYLWFSGHKDGQEEHRMKLRAQKNEFKCRDCDEMRRGWRYKCEKDDCREEIEVRCIMKYLHFPVTPTSGRKRDKVWKGLKFLGKCFISIGPAVLTGLFGGNAVFGN